jgi:hypothetical protein
MLSSSSSRIWLYLGIAVMRKQFDGLAALVSNQIQMRINSPLGHIRRELRS